jgi:hypothetical protein
MRIIVEMTKVRLYYIIKPPARVRKGICMRSKYFYSILTVLFLLFYLPISGACADSWKAATLVNQDLNAVWGTTDGDIYAAGTSNTLLHYDGGSWEQISQIKNSTPSIDLMSLWGAPPVPVVCGGKQGIFFLDDGMRWLKFTLTSTALSDNNALWGLSATNIYAVGSSGVIRFFNGTSWNSVTSTITSLNLYCIWGSSADNILIGGELGTLLHYNGITWESVSLGSINQDLRAIWGSSASDVYATGSDGDILHYDGSTWNPVFTTSGISLYTLWGSAADDVFAAGNNGKIFHHYDDGVSLGWHDITPSISINDIKAAWGSTSGKVYFVCKNGQLLTYTRSDRIPPVIYYSELSKDNDGKVYISTPVSFHFSEMMKDSTVNSTTVILKSGSSIVPGTVSLSSDKMTIAIGDLAYSTTYTAIVTGGSNGVKDIAGNALKSDYSVSFTVESEPGKVPGTGNGRSGCFISSARL